MSRKQKAFNASLTEEKVRFKLYKSGKQWIKAGLKEFELLRIMGIPFYSRSIVKSKNEINEEKGNILAKQVGKTSAMVGGALTVNLLNDHYALADSEPLVTSELSSFSETVATQNSTKINKANETFNSNSISSESEENKVSTSESNIEKSESINNSNEISKDHSTSGNKDTSEKSIEKPSTTEKNSSEIKSTRTSTASESNVNETSVSLENKTSNEAQGKNDSLAQSTSIDNKKQVSSSLSTSESKQSTRTSTSITSTANSNNVSTPTKFSTVNRMSVTTFAAAAATAQSDNVVVTKDNFNDNMKLSGSATFNQSTGVVTLTPDQNSLKGAVSLNTKINSNKSFRFEGKVNLGNKYEGKNLNGRTGGDGIGFAFSPGALGEIGKEGAAVGIGGLKNAFGFKLDTYHNTSKPNSSASANADPSKVAGGGAFGAFVTTNASGVASTYISNNTAEDAAKLKVQPEDNSFQDFIIDYNGDTKVMTVTYAGQTWTRNISDWIKQSGTTNFSLSMTASTGGASNLQQVQFGTFTYTESAVAQAKYVDVTTGKEILPPQKLTGDVDSTVTLDDQSTAIINKGYAFVSTDSSNAPNYNTTSKAIKLTNQGQTVIYYYKDVKAPTVQITNQTKEVGAAILNCTQSSRQINN